MDLTKGLEELRKYSRVIVVLQERRHESRVLAGPSYS